MEFGLIVFAALFLLVINDVFGKPEKPPKTPEQELGDALAKFLKAQNDQKGKADK